MKPLFICTSALHTKHGVFTAEQRLAQTIQTFESIKAKVPDSRILLIESSGESSITEEESEKIKPYVEGILNYNPDQQVQDVYKLYINNHDITKNLTELCVFGKALDFILRQQPHLLNDVDRVFKMSGRYILNDDFDLSKHIDPAMAESYIFSSIRNSQFPPEVTSGLTKQVMSRLWSWNPTKTALVFFRYNLMMEDFIGTINSGKYRDIEHLLLHYFNGHYLKELSIIGVNGQIGPNGNMVFD